VNFNDPGELSPKNTHKKNNSDIPNQDQFQTSFPEAPQLHLGTVQDNKQLNNQISTLKSQLQLLLEQKTRIDSELTTKNLKISLLESVQKEKQDIELKYRQLEKRYSTSLELLGERTEMITNQNIKSSYVLHFPSSSFLSFGTPPQLKYLRIKIKVINTIENKNQQAQTQTQTQPQKFFTTDQLNSIFCELLNHAQKEPQAPMDQDQENFIVERPRLADLHAYPALIEAIPSLEDYFFKSPLGEEKRRMASYSCPKNTATNYQPPILNESNPPPSLKKEDSLLQDFQAKLANLTRPIDMLIHNTISFKAIR
ncbi:hypothetical protein BB558_006628, partial [Smittium angustum]